MMYLIEVRAFSLAITSLSSLLRASGVSVALLNSKSSVEARLIGFGGAGLGASGLATGAGAGAGAGVGAGRATGAGAAGAGFGAGFSGSVAQPAMTSAAADTAAASSLVCIVPSRVVLIRPAQFKAKQRQKARVIYRKTLAFSEGKRGLA